MSRNPLDLVALAVGSVQPWAYSCRSPTRSQSPSTVASAVFGLEADWHPLDPLRADAVDDADVDDAIYGTLLGVTSKGEIVPGLAKGYTVSADGMTLGTELRPGMIFQDGTPFDADAVKFNLDRELDPKNDCWCRSFISSISSVETKGPDHVILHLSKPYAPLPYSLAGIFGGLVASPPRSRNTARTMRTTRSARDRSASSASSLATTSRWSAGPATGTRAAISRQGNLPFHSRRAGALQQPAVRCDPERRKRRLPPGAAG